MSSLGDIVLTEPVVAAIRRARPEATIGFVVKERFSELVNPNPAVDRVHVWRRSSPGAVLDLSREIRAAGYSAVVDLHGNPRSRVLSALSGATTRSEYLKRDPLDSLRVRFLRGTYRARRKIVERYLDALEPHGLPHPYRRPRFHLDLRARDRAERMLEDAGLTSGRFAVVFPGSVWETKRWPADRFSEAVARLAAELGLPSLVLGSREESPLCDRVAADAGSLSLAGAVGLGEAAALIDRAGVFIGNDSGPTHMAMALDTPTVAVFGPTDPSQFDFSRHALVYAGVSCSACSFHGSRRCRHGHWRCMATISVDEVLDATRELIERRYQS